MARYRNYRKNQVKSIVTAVISIALIVAVVAGMAALFTRESKRISPTVFSVGGIHSDGKHVAVKISIYTKDFIECQGLTIEPDFEAKGTFQVFYYDDDKSFLGATDTMNATDGVYSKLDTFPLATYCRIMITPEIEIDEDDKDQEVKIHFYEVLGYANDYAICVYRDQTPMYRLSEFDETTMVNGYIWQYSEASGKVERVVNSEGNGAFIYDPFTVKGEDKLCLRLFEYGNQSFAITLIFTDKDGAELDTVTLTGTNVTTLDNAMVIDSVVIPEGAVNCYVNNTAESIGFNKIYFK